MVRVELLNIALFGRKDARPGLYSLLPMFPFLGILTFFNSLRFVMSEPIIDKLRCTIPPIICPSCCPINKGDTK